MARGNSVDIDLASIWWTEDCNGEVSPTSARAARGEDAVRCRFEGEPKSLYVSGNGRDVRLVRWYPITDGCVAPNISKGCNTLVFRLKGV
jgi:hypothetical protein